MCVFPLASFNEFFVRGVDIYSSHIEGGQATCVGVGSSGVMGAPQVRGRAVDVAPVATPKVQTDLIVPVHHWTSTSATSTSSFCSGGTSFRGSSSSSSDSSSCSGGVYCSDGRCDGRHDGMAGEEGSFPEASGGRSACDDGQRQVIVGVLEDTRGVSGASPCVCADRASPSCVATTATAIVVLVVVVVVIVVTVVAVTFVTVVVVVAEQAAAMAASHTAFTMSSG